MDELNVNSLIDHHKKILNVNNHPYGHCTTKNFLPEEVIKSISISIVYFILGVIIFYSSYLGAKQRGTLINMGE